MTRSIIRATIDQLDLIAPLFDGYRQFYKQPSNVDKARQFIKDRLIRHESVIFLALLDEAAVGFTQLYPSFSSTSMQRLWILNDLFVAPDGRRSGVGGMRCALSSFRENYAPPGRNWRTRAGCLLISDSARHSPYGIVVEYHCAIGVSPFGTAAWESVASLV